MPEEYDSQYITMNSGVNRRPAPRIGAPSLVWHRAYWKPASLTRDEWYEEINDILYSAFLRLWRFSAPRGDRLSPPPHFVCPNYDHEDRRQLYLFRSSTPVSENLRGRRERVQPAGNIANKQRIRNPSFSVRTKLFGLEFTLSAALHTEYWTLTTIADYSSFEEAEALPMGARSVRRGQISEHISRLSKYLIDLQAVAIARSDRSTLEVDRTASDDAEFKREDHVLIDSTKQLMRDILGHSQIGNVLHSGGAFADSFGVILGLRSSEKLNEDETPILIETPKPQEGQGIRAKIGAEYKFDTEMADHVVDAIWPIVRYSQYDERAEERYGKPEYTASLVHRRRIIYISSIGAVIPEHLSENADLTVRNIRIEPTIYFLVVPAQARWQIGRLVDHLNYAGALRLAALRGLWEIRGVNNSLGELEDRVAAGEFNAADTYGLLEEEFRNIDTVQDAGNPKKVEGGVAFRVQKSRYYRELFKTELDCLDIDRIEGFQTLNRLLSLRTADTYLFIDGVGDRYRRMEDLSFQFSQRARTERVAELQIKINQQTRVANSFLDNADKIVVIPIAYYLCLLLEHIANLPDEILRAREKSHHDYMWIPPVDRIVDATMRFVLGAGTVLHIFAVVLAIGLACAISIWLKWRLRKLAEEKTPDRKRTDVSSAA